MVDAYRPSWPSSDGCLSTQLLLATVLEHTVQKHVLSLELDHTPDSTLSDLLSHADTLKVCVCVCVPVYTH